MISKILKIKGLGKFKNFSNSGNDDLKFLKYTIIFGYNTYGKSTLTTIFRSLKYSNQKYLKGKKSFGHIGNIAIDILDSNNEQLTLSNDKWSNPNIVIFDNHFIYNSVFVGDEIGHKHKSSLHGIFVGENVRQKVSKLKKLRHKQNELEKQRDKIKFGYTKSDLGAFDVFLKAKVVKGVEKEIKKKKEEIKRLKNIASLKQVIFNSPLASKFEKFSISMQKTLDTSAEKNIEEHINNHWKDTRASKNFLADGVVLLKDKAEACVFCGQDLSSVTELVDAFKKVFGATYKETLQEIEKVGEAFLRFDLEAEMAKFTPLGFNCEDILDKEILLKNKTFLNKNVEKKLKDLNYKVDCGSENGPFKIFLAEVTKLHPVFEELEAQEFSAEKQMILENELKQLELSQYRHSNEGIALTKKYAISISVVETKKSEIDVLRKDIVKVTKNAVEKNQQQVNTILKDTLKADFTIQKMSSRSNLTRSDAHFVDYEFVIDGYTIPLSNKHSQDDEEPLDRSYFGNTLSDSDRRLLAIAFFISSLQTDTKLEDKIVVLDDPFSSFDSNRKDYLARAIIDIQNAEGKQPEQVIVFTHDDGFLGRLQDKLPASDTKTLKIKNSVAGGSVLDVCDVNELIEEQFFKDIKYIRDSAENSRNVNEALGKVRKCLERVLRHKYYFSLDKSTLKNGCISSYLDKIDGKCLVKDEILKSNWHEHMHDQHEIMKLSEPEKLQKLRDFLSLLEKI
ncbi:AAA family ATPase [Patescibacteria group bacterium]|nr:AAA family ATPase [Patescibacteria group bacterium]MCG2701900.1 AAA family ATPase [Candidatus Parcubacteria bacterium]MBU4265205.1 AAA family ATPase [Patescibacteria group bacterium]MBU4390769.1 AAA family ATPase [Patescibacteria group bacterium]MBU4397127.1 AAA family ATPase [Patescibacteria group bacterium]